MATPDATPLTAAAAAGAVKDDSADVPSAVAVWAGLNELERTALWTTYLRWRGSSSCADRPSNAPPYDDPYGQQLVAACIPAEQQHWLQAWVDSQLGTRDLLAFMAVRTAELDAQLAAVLQQSRQQGVPISQVVVLGAGIDTRAWRLAWPPGVVVFELDSPGLLGFKGRIMGHCQQAAAAASKGGGGGDSGGVLPQLPPLQCARRVEVATDASKPDEMWQQLLAAGLDVAAPVLWLAEGFIGYLTPEAGSALLALLAGRSAPGSRLAMTVPPSPAERERHNAGPGGGGGNDAGGSGGRLVPLHHETFEEPEDTLARVVAAGWSDSRLLSTAELSAQYGTPDAQAIILAHKV